MPDHELTLHERLSRIIPRAARVELEVEMPQVEMRFIPDFAFPVTDNPGLVLTEDGLVFLVNPDGSRTQLTGGGGGGGFAGWTQVGDPADVSSNGGSLDMGGATITSLLDPVDDQDAATKLYVDTHSGGGLPTGWEQDDQDPANVTTNGGSLAIAGGILSGDDGAGTTWSVSAGNEQAFEMVGPDGSSAAWSNEGFFSAPSAGLPAYQASNNNGATVALDAGEMTIENVLLPFSLGRDGLTALLVDEHGQTTLGAIDADAVASLFVKPTGEAAGLPLAIIEPITGEQAVIIDQFGNVGIRPAGDGVALLVGAPFGTTQDLVELFVTTADGAQQVITVTKEGSLQLHSLGALPAIWAIASPTAQATELARFYGPDGVGNNATQIGGDGSLEVFGNNDGSFLFSATAPDFTIGFFGGASGQQPAPTDPQSLYEGLVAFGLFADGGTLGVASWLQSGDGVPMGSVTPSQVGALYQDTLNAGLYEAVGPSDTEWIQVGGQGSGPWPQGVNALGGAMVMTGTGADSASGIILSDVLSFAGNQNGIYYRATGVDGEQFVFIQLGDVGEYTHTWGADGSYTVPGTNIKGLADGVDPQDAATLAQLTAISGSGLHTAVLISDADSPYTASEGELVSIDASGGPVTVLLTADTLAAAIGLYIRSPGNAVTVDTNGTGNYLGHSSFDISGLFTALVLVYDGAEWAPGGGPLPLGWMQDGSNPASVSFTDGDVTATLELASFQIARDSDSANVGMGPDNGVFSVPSTGVPAFSAGGDAGASSAIDGGAMTGVNFAEGVNPTDLATVSQLGGGGLAIGTPFIWPGPPSTVPDNVLMLDGTAYEQTDWPDLYAALGGNGVDPLGWDTFGGLDAPSAGQFRVPDFRGVGLIGNSVMGSGPTLPAGRITQAGSDTLAGFLGVETVVLDATMIPSHTHAAGSLALPNHVHSHSLTLPNHGHGISDPGHYHHNTDSGGFTGNPSFVSNGNGLDGSSFTVDEGVLPAVTGISVGNPTSNPSIGGAIGNPTSNPDVTGTSAATGGGDAHQNVHPVAVVNWVIQAA